MRLIMPLRWLEVGRPLFRSAASVSPRAAFEGAYHPDVGVRLGQVDTQWPVVDL